MEIGPHAVAGRWEAEGKGIGLSIALLCGCAGMTRQNYYKQRRLLARQSIDESLVLELIRRERCRHPRIGCRKLMHLLKPELESAEVKIGRDRFFALLGRHDLLIEIGRA